MYVLYIGDIAFPIPPQSCDVKINGKNTTVELADGTEINLLKTPGLSDISASVTLPGVQYSYAFYPHGFEEPQYYLNALERLALSKQPFQFILNRELPDGTPRHYTNMTVSLEDYTITDDADNGFDTVVKLKFKQFAHHETGLATILTDASGNQIAVPQTTRANQRTTPATYTVKAGDTLCNIARKFLGTDALYTALAVKNGISNPVKLAVGMVIRLDV